MFEKSFFFYNEKSRPIAEKALPGRMCTFLKNREKQENLVRMARI